MYLALCKMLLNLSVKVLQPNVKTWLWALKIVSVLMSFPAKKVDLLCSLAFNHAITMTVVQ